VYCNGIATSLPRDVQDKLVHSMRGLGRAEILQYGYAIEYDFVPAHQIEASLEAKRVRGLFLAGQINGTSGYEEAAGQGLIAGVNAARQLDGRPPLLLRRDQAYIGVMIDDLTTRPPVEPYRMFTSRAEYRLWLRCDNADVRLTPVGREVGLVTDERWTRFHHKQEAVAQVRAAARNATWQGRRLWDWLKRPEASPGELRRILAHDSPIAASDEAATLVWLEAKYEGYLARQHRQIERFREMESMVLPPGIDFLELSGLRREAREAFARVGPRTLGQAGRISGISPSDITTLWVHLTTRRRAAARSPEPTVR
jgi:tRNA uridine 5-carboxymethylaminomethyl modification enzyme